jgi:hypothetical protein
VADFVAKGIWRLVPNREPTRPLTGAKETHAKPALACYRALPPVRPRVGSNRTALRAHHIRSSIAIRLAEQLRQPRDVGGDPPRLVLGQHLLLAVPRPRCRGSRRRRAPARWRPGRRGRRAPCQRAKAEGNGAAILPRELKPPSRALAPGASPAASTALLGRRQRRGVCVHCRRRGRSALRDRRS